MSTIGANERRERQDGGPCYHGVVVAIVNKETSLVVINSIPDPDPTAAPARVGVADTVAAHLAPVTRFGRDDIGQDAPDRLLDVDVTLTLVQEVHFDVAWSAGARQLPKDITLLGNGTRLKVELNTQLGLARDGCADALRAWVAQDRHAYRRVLPADAAFRHTPGRYGIEFTCQSCFGKCQLPCGDCAGAGKLGCQACKAAGTVHCQQCAGTTRRKCAACVGRGYSIEQTTEQRWDAAANAFVTVTTPVNRPCLGCSGAGSTHCTACTFGQAQCAACMGKCRVDCAACAGAASFPCGACEATGTQHEWAAVTAASVVHEELTFGVVDPALERLIRERIASADLPQYGRYLEAHHVIEDQALGSRYELRIDAVHAELQAAARRFAIYGLGAQGQVLDFVNIAGHLLDDDLVTLERAVAHVNNWGQPRNAALPDALQHVLASELNLLIAEQLGARSARPKQAARAVESHYKSMVDAAYVERATVALRRSFDGLYGADLLRPSLCLAAVTATLAALLSIFGPVSLGPYQCAGGALIAGALGWLGIEQLAIKRIIRSFPEPIGPRLRSQLETGGAVTRWRLALGAALIASAVLGAKLGSALPFADSRRPPPVVPEVTAPARTTPDSIEQSRSTAKQEGLYEIRQEARKFLIAHNKKHKTTFKALEPNLKEQYPKCSAPLTVSWVPKSYGLSRPAVFVRCKKSVSKHERKWETIVPVARTGR